MDTFSFLTKKKKLSILNHRRRRVDDLFTFSSLTKMTEEQEICRAYRNQGRCRYGDECKFSHSEGEAIEPPPRGLCFNFRDGGACDFGDRCRYMHGDVDNRFEVRAAEKAARKEASGARGGGGGGGGGGVRVAREVTVSGAGKADVNGVYVRDLTSDETDLPQYKKTGEDGVSLVLCVSDWSSDMASGTWGIADEQNLFADDPQTVMECVWIWLLREPSTPAAPPFSCALSPSTPHSHRTSPSLRMLTFFRAGSCTTRAGMSQPKRWRIISTTTRWASRRRPLPALRRKAGCRSAPPARGRR